MTDEANSLRRFLFEGRGVRGDWVCLDSSWRSILENHPYPPAVAEQLGQALSAVVLLSATIKFRGSLILQAQGSGPIHTLVAQVTHQRQIRGMAHWHGDHVAEGSLSDLFGDGRLVMTIQNEGSEPYQGVVALQGECLADAIQNYFQQSEQLDTRLWLSANSTRAVGLMLQELPVREGDLVAWQHLSALGGAVSQQRLLESSVESLLIDLFDAEQVRLFQSEPVEFHCGCSRERIIGMLMGLGAEEVGDILTEQGRIEIHCEFCNRVYRFDAVDVAQIFSTPVGGHESSRTH